MRLAFVAFLCAAAAAPTRPEELERSVGSFHFGELQNPKKVMHAEGTRPSRDPDGTRASTSITPNVLTAVSATSALDARRWHL